eukprot:510288-Prymnesium_polylepis.1
MVVSSTSGSLATVARARRAFSSEREKGAGGVSLGVSVRKTRRCTSMPRVPFCPRRVVIGVGPDDSGCGGDWIIARGHSVARTMILHERCTRARLSHGWLSTFTRDAPTARCPPCPTRSHRGSNL